MASLCCCCCCCFSCLAPADPVPATSSRFLSRRFFLCYKLFATVYFVFWSVYWPTEEDIDDAHKFVTYWTWYISAIYFVVSTCTACMFHGAPTASDGPVRGTHASGHHAGGGLTGSRRALLGFQIFSWNVAFVGSLVVPLVFWTVLYDGGKLSTTDLNAHLLIAIIMAIDQLLVATKFERKQMVASLLFSATYVAFNIIWFLAAAKEDRVIYDVMDWGDSIGIATATALVIIFILVPLAGAIHYCVYRLRENIYETCGKGGDGSRPTNDIEAGTAVPAIYSR